MSKKCYEKPKLSSNWPTITVVAVFVIMFLIGLVQAIIFMVKYNQNIDLLYFRNTLEVLLFGAVTPLLFIVSGRMRKIVGALVLFVTVFFFIATYIYVITDEYEGLFLAGLSADEVIFFVVNLALMIGATAMIFYRQKPKEVSAVSDEEEIEDEIAEGDVEEIDINTVEVETDDTDDEVLTEIANESLEASGQPDEDFEDGDKDLEEVEGEDVLVTSESLS